MTDEQAKGESENQIALLTFTNDKSPENMGLLQGLLKMVIHTCFTAKLAVMQAKNAETGDVKIILVGVDHVCYHCAYQIAINAELTVCPP